MHMIADQRHVLPQSRLIEVRAGGADQPAHAVLGAEEPRGHRRDEGIEREKLRDQREEPPGRALEISERRVDPHHGARAHGQDLGQPERQRRARRMADENGGAPILGRTEPRQILGHRLEREAALPGPGEALTRQVGRHDPEVRGQKRHEMAPRVARSPRAVKEEGGRAPPLVPHAPLVRRTIDATHGLSPGPVGGHPVEIHGQSPIAAPRTFESLWASARGRAM